NGLQAVRLIRTADRGTLKRDGLKRDGLKRDGLKRDGLKRDGLKRDGLKRDGLKRDGLKTVPYRFFYGCRFIPPGWVPEMNASLMAPGVSGGRMAPFDLSTARNTILPGAVNSGC